MRLKNPKFGKKLVFDSENYRLTSLSSLGEDAYYR